MASIDQSGLLHAAGDYFATADGQAVYLAGDHTWSDNTSYTNTGPFNFNAFLNVLQGEGANFTRLWAPDSFARVNNTGFGQATLDAFQRTGAGTAADGGPKYDLTQFNQAYFNNLLSDVQAAAAKGVYVDVMLFFDYNMPGADYETWTANPWNGINNVNGTTTNNAAVEQGTDPHLLALQEAYVAKVLDTLKDQPNVLYEVANEAQYDPQTYAWENTIINFVHQYESSHGYLKHPVGMTALSTTGSPTTNNPAVVNAALMASNADWVSPTGGQYQSNPPAATGGKVVVADSDHIFGIGGNADWVWQQFTRGQNVLIMDDMAGTGLSGVLQGGTTPSQVANEVSERLAVGETRAASQLVNLTGMTPSGNLASTQFALANPAAGDYVVYAPNGGSFSVNLSQSSGQTLKAQWMNVGTGQTVAGGSVQAGASGQNFTAPFSGAAALILTPSQSLPPVPSPTPAPVPAPTPTPSPTPAPVPSPAPTPTPTADTLGLTVSEDAWNGDAQFTVAVDGKQVGGVYTVASTALHSTGGTEQLNLGGNFGAGQHDVAVSFINDAWGGTAATDRNLYVDGMTYDGASASSGVTELTINGTKNFTVGTAGPANVPPAPIVGPSLGSGPDQVQLAVSEDAWRGDAQFTVSVDGTQIGGAQTVNSAALHSAGQSEMFTLNGNFGPGSHKVAVSFINDDYGGTASTDRNLYVTGMSYDGVASNNSATMLWNETLSFTVQGPTTSGAVVSAAAKPSPMAMVMH